MAELHAVVGEHDVDLIGDSLDEGAEETRRRMSVGLMLELHEGQLGRPVD